MSSDYPFSPQYVAPPSIPSEYQTNYNNAKKREAILYVCKGVTKLVAQNFGWDRIKNTKIKINGYWAVDGKVYLELAAGIQSASFNKDHWIEGVGQLGIQGRIDNDFSFQTSSTINVKYDASITIPGHDSFITRIKPKNAFVYSVDSSKASGRNNFTKDSWTSVLQRAAVTPIIGRKLTYDDLPIWDSTINQTSDNKPPTSVNSFLDDVRWYEILHFYAQHVSKEHQRAQAETVAYLEALNNARASANLPPIGDKKKDGSGGGGGGGGKKDVKLQESGSLSGIGDDTKPVIYNLPAVKDMYFRSDSLQNFQVNSGNLSQKVSEANKLWNDSKSYKGMIQSYIVPAKLNGSTWWNPAGEKGLQGNNKRINTRRYGFQFQYNPSTVTMAYAGAPQVDIGLQTSGADKVPLIGSSVTSSTVTFQLLINRMNDFKYLDSLIYGTSKSRYNKAFVPLKGKVKVNDLSSLFSEIYSHTGNHPVLPQYEGTAAEVTSINDELLQIRELGTMYDIEYLLRTLLGYQLKSSLRNVYTSDIGYLGAYPVELHLGNNLRYLGIIDGFNISHTIFNQNMVPVFSNLSITFSRLPDFAKPFNEVAVVPKPVDTTKEDTQ
jgi:hypothetical protein